MKSSQPLQLVRIHFEIARGGQNKGKNLALQLEAVKPRNGTEPNRAAAQPNPAKPADPAKAN